MLPLDDIVKFGKKSMKVLGTCVEARGLKELKLVEGTKSSTMKELTAVTMEKRQGGYFLNEVKPC